MLDKIRDAAGSGTVDKVVKIIYFEECRLVIFKGILMNHRFTGHYGRYNQYTQEWLIISEHDEKKSNSSRLTVAQFYIVSQWR